MADMRYNRYGYLGYCSYLNYTIKKRVDFIYTRSRVFFSI